MWFYLAVIGIGLLVWIVFSALTGAAFLTFSILGLVFFVVALIGVRRGYVRGRRKEIFFTVGIILLYGLRAFVRNFIVGIYNFLFSMVLGVLNNRGITKVNIDASQWKLNQTGQTIFDLIVFFGGVVALYAFTSAMADPKVPRDLLGAVLGGINTALFFTYGLLLLRPYIGGVYNNNLLQGATLQLPPIKLPSFRVESDARTPPLQGWDKWLPVAALLLVTIYVVYFVFVKPPSKGGKVSAFSVVGISVLLAAAWILAIGLPLLQ